MSDYDEALLDAIERQVMDYDMSVTMTRCWTNAGRPEGWQVSFMTEAAKTGGKGKEWVTGGGVTLREALTNAFTRVVEKRLAS